MLAREGTIELPNGRRLGYGVAGSSDGNPVLYFGGTPGSRLDLQVGGLATAAAERDVRLVALERPGYGRSDRAPMRRVVDWAEDVRHAADALELDGFAVVGYSGGGPHALACAARLGDRVSAAGCISCVGLRGIPGAFNGMGPNERLLHRLVRLSPGLVELVYRLVRRNAARAPERFFRDFEKDCCPADRAVLAGAATREAFRATVIEALSAGGGGAADDWNVLVRRDWGFRTESVAVPTLLVFGTADRVVPPAQGRDLARRIHDARVIEIPDEGHLLIIEHWPEILNAILDLQQADAHRASRRS
jgi:pimeloyl-ACP methyl ester carboxylesterase